VFVIDSKQWSGSVCQGADGLAWHNHYRLDRTLETVRWEAATISRILRTRATPVLCVHGSHVHGGGLHAQGVAIVPAHLLRSALGFDRVLSDADVAVLAATATTRLHPAAEATPRQRPTGDGGRWAGSPGALTHLQRERSSGAARPKRRRRELGAGPGAGRLPRPGP
jgi:hypothetical protein